MRKLVMILFSVSLFSCNGSPLKTQPADTAESSAADTILPVQNDSIVSSFSPLPWEIDFDKKTKKANADFNAGNLNADSVIAGLNQLFPDIKMEKLKCTNDTLFTIIKDSYYLTEGMGTTGSATYLANAIINLTSVSGINHVKINFREGSHASPDTWSKTEFDDYTIVQ